MTKTNTEAVAWLYENEEGSKELILDCNSEYARRLLEFGYTETPLAALSPTAKTEPSAAGSEGEPYSAAEIEFVHCLLDRYSENGGTISIVDDHRAFMVIVRRHAAALSAPTRERELLREARERLRAIQGACGDYLPPDSGISEHELANTVIGLTDDRSYIDLVTRIDNLLNEGSGR